MNRRTFTKTVLAGVGAAALPEFAYAQASPKRLKIGITMLIFGAVPRTPENLEVAMKDSSELGYHSFETFASILEDYEKGTSRQCWTNIQVIEPRSDGNGPIVPRAANRVLQRYAKIVKNTAEH